MLPHFLIIGAQKSASTFIHRCLLEHPDVFMPHHEVRFFEDPHYDESRIGELEALYPPEAQRKLFGVKRPGYLARPECAARIYKHCPQAKLIVVLRNPAERAVSAYFHYVNYGFIPAKNIETGMRDIIAGRYARAHPGAANIIEYGYYYKHLTRYLNWFDKTQLHVVLFDDIKANALEAVQRVYKFLGVDENYLPRALGTKPQSVVYSLTRLRLRAQRNRFIYTYDQERSRSYPKQLSQTGRLISGVIAALDRRVLARVCSNDKPQLSRSLKHELSRIYEADIQSLETLLGRDLSRWKAA